MLSAWISRRHLIKSFVGFIVGVHGKEGDLSAQILLIDVLGQQLQSVVYPGLNKRDPHVLDLPHPQGIQAPAKARLVEGKSPTNKTLGSQAFFSVLEC